MREQKLPKYLQPMLATLADGPFDDAKWIFESKWDGFRVVTEIKKRRVTLYSRNGEIINERYLSVVKELEEIPHDCVLDGELIALDKHGISRFQLLQNALRSKVNLRYYIFDIMFLDGKDMRSLTLLERKEELKKILPKSDIIRFSEHHFEQGKKYFNAAMKKREEGIMAKRALSPYLSGQRTREWLKIKTSRRQEVVIIGFTKPRRSRKYFGSLVVAVREGKEWRYAGHVGTGFNAAALKQIHSVLTPLIAPEKPFIDKVKNEHETTWVEPRLIGEVKFLEWTKSGEMRHPSFIGLRSDKRPEEVVRE